MGLISTSTLIKRDDVFPRDETPMGEPGHLSSEAVASNPGRGGSRLGEKPTEEETPFRSKFYVSARHSADGNDYALGDPIPEIEAIRQGVYNPEPGTRATPIASRRLCVRCGGSGAYSRRKPRGHQQGCGCKFCAACPVCNGTRYVKEGNDGSEA